MTLEDWQRAIYPRLRELDFTPAPSCLANSVTVLSYFFWPDERINTEFWRIEFAFLCTFKCFGILPAVIVTNRKTSLMESFANRFPNVNIIIEDALGNEPDGVKALCIESISRLHTRFESEYVLTIQTDGMPVNPGLENFIGKYDYIGAPWPRFIAFTDFFPYPRFGVGNGGFSLRSKRICAAASHAYSIRPRWIPYRQTIFGDDMFYCRTMPLISRQWRQTYEIAPIDIAARFAIESITPHTSSIPPLGFHNLGFNNYVSRFGIPFCELLTER